MMSKKRISTKIDAYASGEATLTAMYFSVIWQDLMTKIQAGSVTSVRIRLHLSECEKDDVCKW